MFRDHSYDLVIFEWDRHSYYCRTTLQQLGAEIEPDYDQDSVPAKLFLSWNRRYRSHRSVLALGLDRLGLIERSYISMPKFSTEMASASFVNTLDTQLLAQNGITNAHVDRFNRKLPLVLDDEQDIGEMCGDFEAKCRGYYQNSLVSIVTETNFDSDMMSLTEKSFKPFKEKHPFILAAVPGTLAKLRELGFRGRRFRVARGWRRTHDAWGKQR